MSNKHVTTSIDTSRYFRSHLRAPRGRGSWLFENHHGEVVFMHNGTYGEAVKAAKAAKLLNVLYVCP